MHLFRPSGSVNQPSPPATSLRVQQSVQGKGRLVGWGQTRIAGDLIWYGDFTAVSVNQGGGGGKGIGGGGGKGGQGNTTYQYSAAVAIALCEGPISGVFTIWYNKSKTTYQIANNPFGQNWGGNSQSLNLTLFTGTYAQTAWGYLTSLHPGQDLAYRGDAYMAAGPYQLGNSPELPNFSFEVRFAAFGFGADSNTKALLHLNGTNGSTVFPDVNPGGSPHTWTAHGAAKISTATPKFGSGALILSAALTDWIDTPDHADFEPGARPFAVDLWFDFSTVPHDGVNHRALFGKADGFTGAGDRGYFAYRQNTSDKITFEVSNGTTVVSGQSTATYTDVSNTGYHHLALTWDTVTVRMFIDGVLVSSQPLTGSINNTASVFAFGGIGAGLVVGQGGIDECRVTIGDPRWVANFTLPTRAYADLSAYPATTDQNPCDVILDALTNDKYGVGFPASRWEGSVNYSSYCIAAGLVFSPTIADQKAFADHIKDWLLATNSEAVWSGGLLKIVPYGDQNLTGNGATYTVPALPLYGLTDADFMMGSGDAGAPVQVHRARVEDQNNSVSVEFLDITNDYNPAIVEVKDDAAIQVYGLKKNSVTQLHQFTQLSAATMSASLQLGREQIRCTYEFTVQGAFILLDPMDVITITDPGLGSAPITVRIKEIKENEDYTLDMIAEDYLAGSASSPLYGAQPGVGALPDYNASPGVVATPVLFEPTDELAHGLYVWGAVTGANLANWGGCEVWASWDGITYTKMETNLVGSARMGVLSAPLPTFVPQVQGPAIDNTNTLSVDLTMSAGQLASGSTTDNLLFGSMLWVDGELMSYQTATVTGTNKYNLTGLNRGALGSNITAHAAGASFCRVDQGIFSVPFTQDKIGSSLSLKFLSFNKYGGAKQGLQDVGAFSYLIIGTALISPLPDVQNFVSSFVGNITYLDWDVVDDFRAPISYEIRKGANWDTGQFVGTFAHPHVPAIGDANYFIKAVVTPIAGLTVYSENAVQIGISGSVVPLNLLASYDEGPSGTNWPGSLSGSVYNDGTFINTEFSFVGLFTDYLVVPDVFTLTDKLLISDGLGYYTIPDSHIISCGRLAPCLVQIIFAGVGAGSTDFFNPGPPDNNDFFAHSDVFDSAANRFIDVHPEISISTDGVNFGPFQRYQAGIYNMWKITARMRIQSLDPQNVQAILTQFVFQVYAPTRTDHPLVNFPVPAGGMTVHFAPDGGATAAFNGGPNGGTISPSAGITLPNPAALPGIQAVNLSLQAGDEIFLGNISLAAIDLQVKNGGVGVGRSVTLQAWGF